jgi:hypothetical protein
LVRLKMKYGVRHFFGHVSFSKICHANMFDGSPVTVNGYIETMCLDFGTVTAVSMPRINIHGFKYASELPSCTG